MTTENAEITWRVHPAAERKGTAVLVLLLIGGLSVLSAFWMQGVYWGIFAFLVLSLSLESFFLPTRFALRPEGVGVRKLFSRAQRPWSAFRSAWFDRSGVTLSPFSRRHWLETYRGIRLRFSAREGAPGADAVRRYLLDHLNGEQVRFFGLSEQPVKSEGVAAPGEHASSGSGGR
jgi:hypothetical protein